MSGMVDLALDGDEAVEVDPVGLGVAVPGLDSPRPGLELQAARFAEHVDAVRLHADLDDLLPVVWVEEKGTTEFGQSTVGPLHVLRAGVDPEVDVFRVAGLGVVGEGEPAMIR